MKEEALDPRMERVIRFVEGEMDAAERAAFDAELSADPALCSDIEAARRTLGGLRDLGEERLRQEFKDADKESVGAVASIGARWWRAAAAVLVIAGMVWWLLLSRTTPKELADEFQLNEPGLPVLMGAGGAEHALYNCERGFHDLRRLLCRRKTQVLEKPPQ